MLRKAELFRGLAACALSLQCVAGVWAQNYPARPVRLLVAFSAGSGTDTIGRIMASGLTETLGQQVYVENRAGASGNIGAEIAARAAPDGYTLFLANLGLAINVGMFKELNYDLIRDFAPVSQFATGPYVVVVHPSLPVRSLAEFVRLAKSRPGKIEFASAGPGTAVHLAAELFKRQAAIDLLHVPYRGGGEAITAVVSGEVPLYFSPLAPTLPMIQQGRVRALAVTSTTRQALLPDRPTVAEAGYRDYEFGNWYGFMVPAKTPRAVVDTLHTATINALKAPVVLKRLADQGYVTVGDRPEAFGAFLKAEIAKMTKIVREQKVTAD
jgi:tripartite-type tricarboxylate transporter receptor subunit TctC